jgi:hypothetical protein
LEHEQITERAVALAARGTKLTARMLAQAMWAFLRNRQQGKTASQDKTTQGKQSVRQLIGSGASLQNMEITDDNIKSFERTARKYNIDFSLKKDKSVDPPKWIVFFKSKDSKAMEAAFNDFTRRTLMPRKEKSSLLQRLAHFKELAKNMAAPVRNRNRGGHEL